MGTTMPVLYWFDRFDERIGILHVLGEIVHTQEVGGQDTLEFSCVDAVPAKGDRLVWRDGGVWREHVVVRTDEPVDGVPHVYAESSLCELLNDFIEECHLMEKTPAAALSAVCAYTRWSAGTCFSGGLGSCVLYHVNALVALRRIEEVWDCEVTTEIRVVDGRVVERTLRLVRTCGQWRGARFTYGKNMVGCTRTVLEDEVYTALYGFGAGLPIIDEAGVPTGGYRRKLTFGDINGGVDWVGDDVAREVWGRWNADRTAKVHSFGQVTFSDCEDKYLLRAKTQGALRKACVPKVSYDVDVCLVSGSVAVDLGDTVAVVDGSREPAWHLQARVLRRERTFGGSVASCRVVLGTVKAANSSAMSAMATGVVMLQNDVAGIDGQLSATATTTYVNQQVTEAIDDLDDLSTVEF